jgi:predicted PurR-regulated permease PerM
VPVGGFEEMRASIRRAYEASRESIRAARVRAEQAGEEPPELVQLPPAPMHLGQSQIEIDPAAVPARSVEDAVPRSLQIAGAWSWRLIVVALVAWGLLWIANRFLLLVAPLMIGLLLAGLFMPAQRALLRLHVNRSLAALLVVVGGLAAISGTLYLVITAFVQGLPEMTARVEEGIEDLETWLRTGPFGLTDEDLEELIAQGQQWLNEHAQQLGAVGLAAVAGTVQVLTGVILAIVITFFFLRDGGRIWRFLVGMLPPRTRAPIAYAGEGAWGSLSGYVRATVLVALVDGLGIGLGLWILDLTVGMPLVLPLAALVFLGAFVPIVGAFVSGSVAVVVALVSDPGTGGFIKALIVLGIVILVQQIEGNILQPFIVSKMVRIHPLAVIIAVLAGILLAGIIGALVAVPIVAVLNTVIRRLNAYRDLGQTEDPVPAIG